MFSPKEAVSYIEDFTWSKTRLGLSRTRELLEKLGNPQDFLKFVHVAGSNGKGSTCSFIERSLREAGYKTGFYSSPYLSDFSEQLRICGVPIDGEELAGIVDKVAPVADSMEDHPSRFEILTAVGMIYFKENDCDIVILETGMGGELDSTNVVKNTLVCAIANIGLEHTEYLGNTIEEVAAAKAGIIKEGCSVVCYDSDKKAVDVIKKKAESLNTDFKLCNEPVKILSMDLSGSRVEFSDGFCANISMIGEHQVSNAYLAYESLLALKSKGFDIKDEAIKKGFMEACWPARFEVLSDKPLFILDGGHNPQCSRALYDSLEAIFPGRKFTMIMGILEDKDVPSMIKTMINKADRIICLTPDSPRALPADKLAMEIKKIAPEIPVTAYDELSDGLTDATKNGDDVLAFGSLYMAGKIRDLVLVKKKQSQRALCKKRLADMTDDEKSKESADICKKLIEMTGDAKIVFSYAATPTEVDLSVFHEFCLKNGIKLALPRTKEDFLMDFYYVDDINSLERGNYGILEPKKGCKKASPKDAHVIVLPCLGFDDERNRLGHGAGYYDRYLAKTSGEKILVGFLAQRLDKVCTDERDQKADRLCVI